MAVVVVGPYLLAWTLYGAGLVVARLSLRHHYGSLVKVDSCDTLGAVNPVYMKKENLNDIHLNYEPFSSLIKPFYLYKGYTYYVNYKTHEPENSIGGDIGAASGTVTPWGHIKPDGPPGYYGCPL